MSSAMQLDLHATRRRSRLLTMTHYAVAGSVQFSGRRALTAVANHSLHRRCTWSRNAVSRGVGAEVSRRWCHPFEEKLTEKKSCRSFAGNKRIRPQYNLEVLVPTVWTEAFIKSYLFSIQITFRSKTFISWYEQYSPNSYHLFVY